MRGLGWDWGFAAWIPVKSKFNPKDLWNDPEIEVLQDKVCTSSMLVRFKEATTKASIFKPPKTGNPQYVVIICGNSGPENLTSRSVIIFDGRLVRQAPEAKGVGGMAIFPI